MSIKRFKPSVDVVDVDGIEVGYRKPYTFEMIEISKLREAVIEAGISEENGKGSEALIAMQVYISSTLACDPSDPTNPWFAKDAAKQAELHQNGVDKDTPDDVPYDFHLAVANAFLTKSRTQAKERDAAGPTNPTPDSPTPPSP